MLELERRLVVFDSAPAFPTSDFERFIRLVERHQKIEIVGRTSSQILIDIDIQGHALQHDDRNTRVLQRRNDLFTAFLSTEIG